MIGLVLVSHSAALADGLAEVVRQMAGDVPVRAAGGGDDGGIGTSAQRIEAAIAEAGEDGDGVVVLYDLGSAELTTQMVLEMLDPDEAERVRLVDAPLVEGALAAATSITPEVDLDAVVAAGVSAADAWAADAGGPAEPPGAAPEVVDEVTVVNPLGLHARPAGLLARAVRGLDADVEVRSGENRASVASMLQLVALGSRRGDRLEVGATGPDAVAAVARVVELVAEGFGEADDPDPTADRSEREVPGSASAAPEVPPPGTTLRGAPGAPGLALGASTHVGAVEPDLDQAPSDRDADQAAARLEQAVDDVRTELDAAIAGRASSGGGAAAEASILGAHRDLLDDPALLDSARSEMQDGADAAPAWWQAVVRQRDVLAAAGTEVVAARAADVVDVGRRVLARLGVDVGEVTVEPGTVVVAEDLTPTEVAAIADAGAAAAILAGGSPTAHAAVIARGRGLPLVTGLGAGVPQISDGTTLLVDAGAGAVEVDPAPDRLAEFRDRVEEAAERRERLLSDAQHPVRLADGRRMRIGGNVATAADSRAAVEHGAEEVGLLRTELWFVDREDVPSEEEQHDALVAALTALDGRPAVVRTMDVGGDKSAPGLGLDPHRNGFLGQRGLRWSLAHPDVFRAHLRAILRAAARHRVRLMWPFVTTPDELRAARSELAAAAAELTEQGVDHALPEQIGAMIEIPAAAIGVEEIAAEVDFVSIGSNDLIQYLTASDRTLPEVAALAQPGPARLLDVARTVVAGAHAANAWVGVCGEVAGDPELAVALVDAGVDELSMAPSAIPEVKAALRAALGAPR